VYVNLSGCSQNMSSSIYEPRQVQREVIVAWHHASRTLGAGFQKKKRHRVGQFSTSLPLSIRSLFCPFQTYTNDTCWVSKNRTGEATNWPGKIKNFTRVTGWWLGRNPQGWVSQGLLQSSRGVCYHVRIITNSSTQLSASLSCSKNDYQLDFSVGLVKLSWCMVIYSLNTMSSIQLLREYVKPQHWRKRKLNEKLNVGHSFGKTINWKGKSHLTKNNSYEMDIKFEDSAISCWL